MHTAHWRLIIDDTAGPAWNMAVDEALLRLIERPVLRVYGWNVPAVSLGYFQSWQVAPAGRPFVRRYTGGGLVDHAQDVTYTIVLPRVHPLASISTAESYSKIHEGIGAAIQKIGVEAKLAATCDEGDGTACFQKAVKFDVKSGDRKLAGAAQRRNRQGMLHQGSILLPDASLNEKLREALPQVLAEVLQFDWELGEINESERALASDLEVERYATDEWNRMK